MYDNQEEPSEDNSPDAAGVSVPRPVPRKRLVYSSLFQDYMHRGTHPLLSGMPLYVYAMHVTRLEMMTNVLNESTEARFDRHHTAYVTHKQKIRNCVKIPQVQGWSPPCPDTEPERFAVYMLVLFFPVECRNRLEAACNQEQDVYGVLHRDSGVPFEDVWEQHWRGVQRKAEKADARLENRRQTVSLGAFCDEPGLYYAYMTREVVMNSMLIARSRNHQVQTMGQAVRESQAVGGKAHDRKDYPWVAEETHLSDMVNLKAFGEDYEEDPTDNDTAQKRANRKLLAEISAASRSGDTNQLDVTSVLTRAQDLVALHPQADTRHIVVQDAVPGTSATCINESKALMRPRPPGREARPPRPPGLPKKNFFFRHHKIFHQKKKKNFFLGAGDFGKKNPKKKIQKKPPQTVQ